MDSAYYGERGVDAVGSHGPRAATGHEGEHQGADITGIHRGTSWTGRLALLALLVPACLGAPDVTSQGTSPDPTPSAVTDAASPAPASPSAPTPSATASASPTPTPPQGSGASAAPVACEREGGVAMREDASVTLEQIDQQGDLQVYAAEYPLPGETDGLWSQWGQGIVASGNGRHYSALGDHLGPDGNSYLYEYDPSTRQLVRVMDVLSLVDHQDGAWGYGKIHSQMVEGVCGTIWAFTYWGTKDEIEYGDGYEGDLLLELDPATRTVHNHGAVAGEHGVPSLAATRDGRHVIGEVVEPLASDGDFLVVVDAATGAVTHEVEDPDHDGYRALAVDAGDRVLYSTDGGQLMALDPATGETSDPGIELPTDDDEDFLRAATTAADGTVYGVTQESEAVFSLTADGDVTELASSDGYTASLAITPEGDRVFWLPGAHGDAWEDGATIRVLDTASGDVSEVVSLADAFDDELDLRAGGTYSLTYHDGRLIVGMNASDADDDSGFGTVVLAVVEGV